MKKFTIQASIDELEKKVAAGGSGASAAEDVSFDNTGTGLSSDNVQDAIEELDARGVSAADVSFDNTGTGLSSDNIQDAIEELDVRGDYLTDEIVIGKVGNEILYRKMVDCGALPNSTSKTIAHGITALKKVYSITGTATNSSGVNIPLPLLLSKSQVANTIILTVDTTNINIDTGVDVSSYTDTVVTLEYTKNVTENRKRRK